MNMVNELIDSVLSGNSPNTVVERFMSMEGSMKYDPKSDYDVDKILNKYGWKRHSEVTGSSHQGEDWGIVYHHPKRPGESAIEGGEVFGHYSMPPEELARHNELSNDPNNVDYDFPKANALVSSDVHHVGELLKHIHSGGDPKKFPGEQISDED